MSKPVYGQLFIGDDRFEHYSLIAKALDAAEFYPEEVDSDQIRLDEFFKKRYKTIFEVMHQFSAGLPSDHSILNLKNGTTDNLSEEKPEGLR